MKSLVFRELRLISYKEERARRLTFDPRRTVIAGDNDTGKSSIIKSLYRTLGATCHISDRWAHASVKSALAFAVDGEPFEMAFDGHAYALFDAQRQLVRVFRSVTNELGPFLADKLNFHLTLQSRGQELQATPAFLFLPFYVDQDRSWTQPWNSFDHLQQFSNWRHDVVTYHLGIHPSEYYVAKAEAGNLKRIIEELSTQRRVLVDLMKKTSSQLNPADFALRIEDFVAEVEELLTECRTLDEKEQRLKARLISSHGDRALLASQLAAVLATAGELNSDLKFSQSLPQEVQCPTCGVVHKDMFLARFEIARDEDRCRSLASDLQEELRRADEKITTLEAEISPITSESHRLRALLGRKRGELQLLDVIRSEGRREVKRTFEEEIGSLDEKVGSAVSKQRNLQARLREFDDKDRRQSILREFNGQHASNLEALSLLPTAGPGRRNVEGHTRHSGSELPRALLAYYLAVLHTAKSYSSAAFCPIVIDSPRQQDQDAKNWRRILALVDGKVSR